MYFNNKEYDTIEEIETDEIFISLLDGEKQKIRDNFWIETIKEKTEDLRKKEIENIYNEFENSLKPYLEWYTRIDRDSFMKQLEEAKIVKDWWESQMISLMCKEWETAQELAEKIIQNNNLFSLAYAQANKIKREKLALLWIN